MTFLGAGVADRRDDVGPVVGLVLLLLVHAVLLLLLVTAAVLVLAVGGGLAVCGLEKNYLIGVKTLKKHVQRLMSQLYPTGNTATVTAESCLSSRRDLIS